MKHSANTTLSIQFYWQPVQLNCSSFWTWQAHDIQIFPM